MLTTLIRAVPHSKHNPKNAGVGKVVGFVEAFVSEPKDVEAGLEPARLLIHLSGQARLLC